MGRGRRPPRDHHVGRPSVLTPERSQRIINKIRAGNYIATVAATEGIGKSTLFQWLQQGHNALEQLADNPNTDMPKQAHLYAEFAEGVMRARADSQVAAVEIVQSAMAGGFLLEEEPVVAKNGDLVYGPDGELLMRRKWAPPDGKLAMTYLQATDPGQWRPNTQRVEITSPEGLQEATAQPGAVEGDGSRAGQLAERLAAHVLQRQQEAIEAGVVDAEVVDETAGEYPR